jgi:hypothetical protein
LRDFFFVWRAFAELRLRAESNDGSDGFDFEVIAFATGDGVASGARAREGGCSGEIPVALVFSGALSTVLGSAGDKMAIEESFATDTLSFVFDLTAPV